MLDRIPDAGLLTVGTELGHPQWNDWAESYARTKAL